VRKREREESERKEVWRARETEERGKRECAGREFQMGLDFLGHYAIQFTTEYVDFVVRFTMNDLRSPR